MNIENEYEAHLSKVDILRELDSLIDFAKGSIQLKIIIALANSRNGLTAKDISMATGLKYKTVQDAIRKLVSKDLVVKESNSAIDMYKLSSKGEEYFSKLIKILNGSSDMFSWRGQSRRVLLPDFINNMVLYDHIADAVIAIATSSNGELPLSKIAEAMKLSPERARSYLDLYSERISPIRLFKRYEKESRIRKIISKILRRLNIGIRINVAQPWYRLTDEGMTVFYRHPYYLKYKKSRLSTIVTKLIGSAHPRIVIRFITRVSLIILAVSMYVSLINPHIASIVLALSTAVVGLMFAMAHNIV